MVQASAQGSGGDGECTVVVSDRTTKTDLRNDKPPALERGDEINDDGPTYSSAGVKSLARSPGPRSRGGLSSPDLPRGASKDGQPSMFSSLSRSESVTRLKRHLRHFVLESPVVFPSPFLAVVGLPVAERAIPVAARAAAQEISRTKPSCTPLSSAVTCASAMRFRLQETPGLYSFRFGE